MTDGFLAIISIVVSFILMKLDDIHKTLKNK